MSKIINSALTFNDVLLVPKRSAIVSRKEIITKTKLSRNIELDIPIVSANMDTVTESKMAIAMARLGGMGIIHRFMPIDEQVKEVKKVKRLESFTVEVPYTLSKDSTLRDAKEAKENYGVSGLLIVDKEGRLEGILTQRDILFVDDESTKVKKLMTPKEKLITALPGTGIDKAKKILHKHKIEKLPLVDEQGFLRGLVTSKDILRANEFPNATKDKKGRLMVGAAIGAQNDAIGRSRALLEAGVDVLVIDVAHGHSQNVFKVIDSLRKKFGDIEIIAGNVATAEGTADLIKAGVDAVKIGIGPGSICTTRIVAGVGVPQFSAILSAAKAAEKTDVPIIADGGIRCSGDITKSLAAGASTVMLGNLLAGTEESPGLTLIRNGQKYKISRGMASFGAVVNRKNAAVREKENDPEIKNYVAEGVEAVVPYRGAVAEVVAQLVGGLRSGMSYCNSRTIHNLQKNAEFIQISEASWRESLPHDVKTI